MWLQELGLVWLVGWLNKIAWRWRLIILSWKMGVPLRPLKIELPEPSLTITQLVWLVKGESKKMEENHAMVGLKCPHENEWILVGGS